MIGPRLRRTSVALAIVYGSSWAATAALGCPQLERELVRRMQEDSRNQLPKGIGSLLPGAEHDADAYSPAPFVVVVDHTSGVPGLCGRGGTSTNLWAPGLHREIATSGWYFW